MPKLRIDLIPQPQSQELDISFTWNNIGPGDIEQKVTSKLENIFSQLNELQRIESKSLYNRGQIILVFNSDADIQMKRFEVATLIRQIYPLLPVGVSYPAVSEQSISQEDETPLLIYSIYGANESNSQISDQVKKSFARPLVILKDISRTTIVGGIGQQVNIDYSDYQIRLHGIDKNTILAVVNRQMRVDFPGSVRINSQSRLFIKLGTQERTIERLKNLEIPTGGRSIKLKDIASIYLDNEEAQRYFRVNGNNAINFLIYPQKKINAISLAEELKRTMHKLASNLPAGYALNLEYDDSEYLQRELDKNFRRIAFSTLILCLLTFLVYRNGRDLLLLFLNLVMSCALMVLMIWAFRINIHFYTLAGFAVAIGIIIDNMIIVIDHYRRFRNMRIISSATAAGANMISVLLLFELLPDEIKSNLNDFFYIIVAAVVSSLISSFFLIRSLSDVIFKTHDSTLRVNKVFRPFESKVSKNYFNLIRAIALRRKGFVIFLILLFGTPIFLLPKELKDVNWYNNMIGSAVYQINLRPYIDRVFGGTLRLFVIKLNGSSSNRELGQTKLTVFASLPYGTTVHQMDDVLKPVESMLKEIEGIKRFVTNIYSGQSGKIEITFKESFEKGTLPGQLKSKLITSSLNWSGIGWTIEGVGEIFNNSSLILNPSYKVLMKGYNFDELENQAKIFSRNIAIHKRVQNININEKLRYDEKSVAAYYLQFDPKKLKNYSLLPSEVITGAIAESRVSIPSTYLLFDNKLTPVFIREKNSEQFSPWRLLHSSPLQRTERKTEVRTVANIETLETEAAIYKENRQYLRLISFDYFGAKQFGDKVLNLKLEEAKHNLPIGYTIERINDDLNSNNRIRFELILLIIVVSFIICSILFENLLQPFLVIVTIPISFVGIFLSFALFPSYFDQGGFASFIYVGAIVGSASIYVINEYNVTYLEEPDWNMRIIKTLLNRGKTILTTTIVSCFGMIPFLLEGQGEVFWYAFAMGTIGGLLFSLITMFVFLPVLMWKPFMKSQQ